MLTYKVSNVHQVIGQMIRGDYDDDSNWQMVEYVFDKLNTEGCDLGLRFFNTLLEALWWMGQKERAARVLNEATKRGLYPELFRKNKLVWAVDVHRYCWNLLIYYFILSVAINVSKLFILLFLDCLQDVAWWCMSSNISLAQQYAKDNTKRR